MTLCSSSQWDEGKQQIWAVLLLVRIRVRHRPHQLTQNLQPHVFCNDRQVHLSLSLPLPPSLSLYMFPFSRSLVYIWLYHVNFWWFLFCAEKIKELVLKCLQARDLAYCPYSRFPVGAAILTTDGAIITGKFEKTNSNCKQHCYKKIGLWCILLIK